MRGLELYHGTIADFQKVSLSYAKANKDFGKGFYLTSDVKQARDWVATLKKRMLYRGKKVSGFVYCFKLDLALLNDLNTHKFKGANRAWLDYVLRNRDISTRAFTDYDVVIGKVADANVQVLIDNFKCNGDYSNSAKDTLIRKLKTENLTNQYCFKTAKAVSLLNSSFERWIII